METLRYVGEEGPAGMKVPGCGEVRRGKTIDVPDEMAAVMLKRGGPKNWELAKAKATKAEKPAAKEHKSAVEEE